MHQSKSKNDYRKAAAIYLYLQAILGLLWWIALFWFPSFRGYFLPEGYPDEVLLSMVVADNLLFVAGSFVAGSL